MNYAVFFHPSVVNISIAHLKTKENIHPPLWFFIKERINQIKKRKKLPYDPYSVG